MPTHVMKKQAHIRGCSLTANRIRLLFLVTRAAWVSFGRVSYIVYHKMVPFLIAGHIVCAQNAPESL